MADSNNETDEAQNVAVT